MRRIMFAIFAVTFALLTIPTQAKDNLPSSRLLFASTAIQTLPTTTEATSAKDNNDKLVDQIAKSGDQRILAVTYRSGGLLSTNVELYDSSSGELIRTVDLSPSIPFIIALSPSGDRIAHTSADGEIKVFDINSAIDTILLGGGAITLNDLKWNPTNDEIAYIVGSGIYILNALNGNPIRSIGGGIPLPVSVAWNPDGIRLATSHFSIDPFNSDIITVAIKVWDLSVSGEPLITPVLKIENRGGGDIAWSPDGTQLAMLESGGLLIYDVITNQANADLSFKEQYPVTVVWNPSGNQIATGGTLIRVWNTTTWELVKTMPVDGSAGTLQWSPDGKHLFNEGGTKGLYRDNMPVYPLTP